MRLGQLIAANVYPRAPRLHPTVDPQNRPITSPMATEIQTIRTGFA